MNDVRSDAELVGATARGDDVAFTVLVRRHIRPATLLAAQLLGDRDEAEDCVQDVFTVVYRRAGDFDVERPFAPWFYAIVRRLAANRRTREARRARLLRWWGAGQAETSHADQSEAELDASKVNAALQDLSPMQKACFELVVLRGLTTEEVAAMHDIAESTVRQHVFRARASLRAALREPESADETS